MHNAAEFGDGLPRLLRQSLNVLAQRVNLLAFLRDEVLPAMTAEAADAPRPVRIQFVAEMLLEEIGAIDTLGLGQAQQLALKTHQAAVDAVHLVDKSLDAIVVELEPFDEIDRLDAQFPETALLAVGKLVGAERGFDARVLQLAELLIQIGNFIER